MDLHETGHALDPRVRRTRTAVLRATVELVSSRGTAVTLSEIAEAADVSRRVVYQHFGDLDGVLLEAGLDLARRELLPRLGGREEDETLLMARHFARHQAFYGALLTSSCAYALDRGLINLFVPVNRQVIAERAGDRLSAQALDDLAAFVAGGAGSFVTTWVIEGAHDPEAFTDRLIGVISTLMTAMEAMR